MTDRDMLLFAYGALKALVDEGNKSANEVVSILEAHLFPPRRYDPNLQEVEDEEHA